MKRQAVVREGERIRREPRCLDGGLVGWERLPHSKCGFRFGLGGLLRLAAARRRNEDRKNEGDNALLAIT